MEDSYDPEHYRLAVYKEQNAFDNFYNLAGRTTIAFNCKPQRFLKSGDQTVRFTAAGVLRNPTAFPAKPLIKVRPALGTLMVGQTTVEIKAPSTGDDAGGIQPLQTLYLDCETQNAYTMNDDGTLENKNNCIYAPVFPELLPGDNEISWDGAILTVEIIPRWWTL